jgi:hypothetical protein
MAALSLLKIKAAENKQLSMSNAEMRSHQAFDTKLFPVLW